MRKIHRLIVLSIFTFFAGACYGEKRSCEVETKKVSEIFSEEVRCYCQPSELSNLQVVLPKELKLIVACRLFNYTKAIPIDLTKEKINLDDHVSNTLGYFFLKGKLNLTGNIRYCDNDDYGRIYFTPNKEFRNILKTSFSKSFRTILISSVDSNLKTPKDIKIPNKFVNTCIEAFAEIRIDGLEVMDWESEFNGAKAIKRKIIKLGTFKEVKDYGSEN